MRSGILHLNIVIICCILFSADFSLAQSTSQSFPTPITSNEISGSVRARDLGDSRLTSYFYAFDGEQGDLFVNVVTKNFTGDIDVFLLTGLRPLTKIVIYSDLSENETGRVIYLRKPEKLLLRVQGRSPNDDAAAFKIKFAGSFVAAKDSDGATEPALPEIKLDNVSGIRVNSVGTILERIPKAVPSPKEITLEAKSDENADQNAKKVTEETIDAKDAAEQPKDVDAKNETKSSLEVVVTENLPPKVRVVPPKRTRRIRARPQGRRPLKAETQTRAADEKPAVSVPKEITVRKTRPTSRAKNAVREKLPDPLENIRLVILFKDGKAIERPMNEVFKFSVDKGMLTVISKDGRVGRYSILDVAKVTIE